MIYAAKVHRRRSLRLQGYDYSLAGGYFVTVVTKGRENLFGAVAEGEMHLTQFGKITRDAWLAIPRHYPHVILDEYCIMPNHFHGILFLSDDGSRGGSVQANSLPDKDDPAGASDGQDRSQSHPYGVGHNDISGRGGSVQANSLPDKDEPAGASDGQDRSQTHPYKRHGLPEIMRAFKSFSARKINIIRRTPGVPVWQRNYYEHIIRNEKELIAIQRYIRDNPCKWDVDSENLSQENPEST